MNSSRFAVARSLALVLGSFLGGCVAEAPDDIVTGGDPALLVSAAEEESFDDLYVREPHGDGHLARIDTRVVKCNAPKVQICHLPGGDLNKAETLCIAAVAVQTHEFHHGDSIGACGPTCSSEGGTCSSDSSCCDGFCSGGACRAVCQVRGGACDSASDCCTGMACSSGACVAQI